MYIPKHMTSTHVEYRMGSVQQTVLKEDLEMCRVREKFVPCFLTEDKMKNRKL